MSDRLPSLTAEWSDYYLPHFHNGNRVGCPSCALLVDLLTFEGITYLYVASPRHPRLFVYHGHDPTVLHTRRDSQIDDKVSRVMERAFSEEYAGMRDAMKAIDRQFRPESEKEGPG